MKYNEKSPLIEQFSSCDNSVETSIKCEYHGNNQRKGATWLTGAFLLANTALGAGLLNYPVAYDRLGGIGFATAIQVILLFVIASTMYILIFCADETRVNTYHDVLEQMCGHKVRQLAALSILISCYGICMTFLIIIGDQFDRIFATFFGNRFCYSWYLNRSFTIGVTAVLTIWPMSYCRRLDFLKHANMLGVFATLYVIFLNVYQYYKLDVIPGPIKTYPDSIITAIAALPVVCFAYQTHEVVVPVYDCLKESKTKNFMISTMCALLLMFTLYCISGTFGYLTFGSTVAPDIMLMYNASDPIVSAGIVALIVKMMTSYPPVIFSGRDTFINLFCKPQDPLLVDRAVAKKDSQKRFAITTIGNVVVLILSIVTPNISIAIGFLGSLAACNVFVFPGLCMTSLSIRLSRREENSSKKRIFRKILLIYGFFIIITGIFMFFIILYQVITDLSAEAKHDALCQ